MADQAGSSHDKNADKPKSKDAEKSKPGDKPKEVKPARVSKPRAPDGRQSVSSSGAAPAGQPRSTGKVTDNELLGSVVAAVKELTNSQKQFQETVTSSHASFKKELQERMDGTIAAVEYLKEEWNVKSAGGSNKTPELQKAFSPDYDPNWGPDSDDEKLEDLFPGDDVEEDEASDVKEESEENYDDVLYGKDQKGMVPTIEEITLFQKRTKLHEDFGEDDWKTAVNAKNAVKFWVGRGEARDFAGPQADHDAPTLRYKNLKQNEKDFAEIQRCIGAINFAQIHLAEETKSVADNVEVTRAEFASPDIDMQDPRQEAALSMEGVKEAIMGFMKTLGSLGKMAAFLYGKMTAVRRAQFIEAVDSSRGAKEMIKRLKPSTRYLFGDSIKRVCRTLKEGSQLSSVLQKPRSGRGHWPGKVFARGGRGYRGNRGYRGRSEFRGGFRKKSFGRGRGAKEG